jgi:hypothetical protein
MLLVTLLFWAFLACYIVHVIDETLLNGGFVKWIADNFWADVQCADVLLVQRRIHWGDLA